MDPSQGLHEALGGGHAALLLLWPSHWPAGPPLPHPAPSDNFGDNYSCSGKQTALAVGSMVTLCVGIIFPWSSQLDCVFTSPVKKKVCLT